MAGGVICSVGRSSDATRVAAAAADVAGQLGLRLVVVDAGRPSPPERSEAFLEGVAEAAGLRGAELHVEPGDPVGALLELAEREAAELIVVSHRDPVLAELLARAPWPVLSIPVHATDSAADPEETLKRAS